MAEPSHESNPTITTTTNQDQPQEEPTPTSHPPSRSYEYLIPEDQRDIMALEQVPRRVEYALPDGKAAHVRAIPSLFVAIDTFDQNIFIKSVIFVVRQLVPDFKDVPPDCFSFRHFTEGITNKLVCVTNTLTNQAVNVRTFGSYTEFVIDRTHELLVMEACNNVTLYGTFLNGIVYSFIPGRTLVLADLIDLTTFQQTASAVAHHHRLTPPLARAPLLFVTLRKWLVNVPRMYVDPRKKPFDVAVLKRELVFLEETLRDRSDIVLCHNDLLLKNFVKDRDAVSLIDFEYSSYNYRAFDLANHFNEWCGFECRWENYPTEETQKRFLTLYLAAFHNRPADQVAAMVQALYDDVRVFQLASHFFWGTWALIQAALSSIDFGYLDYAYQRFDRYFSVKAALFPEASH